MPSLTEFVAQEKQKEELTLTEFVAQQRKKVPKREKGLGYFGPLKRPDGRISTELSIRVTDPESGEQGIEIPSLVPTLTQEEIDLVLSFNPLTPEIINKAQNHALMRIEKGLNPFAQKGEQQPIKKKPWWIGPAKKFLQAYKLTAGKPEEAFFPEIGKIAAKKIGEFAVGITQLGPTLAERIAQLEEPPRGTAQEILEYPGEIIHRGVTKGAVPLAKEFIKEEYKTFKKIAQKPITTALEEPEAYMDAGITALWVLGGVFGQASKITRAVKTANRIAKSTRPITKTMPQRYTKINLMNEAGSLESRLVKRLPDELSARDITSVGAMVVGGQRIPDPKVVDTALRLRAEDASMRKVLDAVEITGQGVDPKFLQSTRDFFRVLNEARHSPDVVLGKYGVPGTKIYEIADVMDLGGLEFLYEEMNAYIKATKHARRGDINYGVFRSVNEGLEIPKILKMIPEEYKVYGFTAKEIAAIKKNPLAAIGARGFYKTKYEEYIRTYGIMKAGKAREPIVWDAANKFKQRKIPVEPEHEIARGLRADMPRGEVLTRGFNAEEIKLFNVYKGRIINYIPHMFERSEVLGQWQANLRRLEGQIAKEKARGIPPLQNEMLKELYARQDAALAKVKAIEGGAPILFDLLPGKYQFRYFKHREGAPGYSVDAAQAFKSYLTGIKKKIFDETAIDVALKEYPKLPPEGQAYAKWFLRDFMGYNRARQLDSFFGTLKSLQWIRTLGFNPRSAIVNLTQRVNTVVELGPTRSIDGYRFGFTKEGKALFAESGIERTIPQVLMEGGVAGNSLEGLRSIAGWMFSRIEKGNQKQAFLGGYLKGRAQGMSVEASKNLGRLTFEKTQFRYGRVGMPKMLRGGKGVVFQFWSYPLKQIEFLTKLYKEDPAKFFGWVALAEGAEYTVDEFLGLDLSNALGFGMNYGELFEALEAFAEKEPKKGWLRLKQAPEGGGIFPYGLGPTMGLITAVMDTLGDVNLGMDRLSRELMPVSIGRAIQVTRALIQGETEGTAQFGSKIARDLDIPELDLPLYDLRALPMDIQNLFKGEQKEMLLGRETIPQLLSRVFLAKPQIETEAYQEKRDAYLEEQVRRGIQGHITTLLLSNDIDKINQAVALMIKYKITPSDVVLKNAILRQVLTPLERFKLKLPKKGEAYREEMRK